MSRTPLLPFALLTIGCGQESLVLHADLTIEAAPDVAQELAYPLVLELGVSPDADGESIMGSQGRTVPEHHVVCEPPADGWAIDTELSLSPSGRCEDLDPHIVVDAIAITLDGDCEPGRVEVTEEVDDGTLIAWGIQRAFEDLDVCGSYSDDVTLALQLTADD